MSEKPERIPGRTFRRYDDGKTVYIYSSLDKIVIATDNNAKADNLVLLDKNKHHKIYADTVQFNSSIELNAQYSFTLFARQIKCLMPGDTVIRSNGAGEVAAPVYIGDASHGGHGASDNGKPCYCDENAQDGHDGDSANGVVHDGEKGENGGVIAIFAQKLTLPDKNSRFIMEALGGVGHPGQNGQNGGNGGNGFYRLYSNAWRVKNWDIYQSGYGGRAGNATYGGKGGNGGNGGTISVFIDSVPLGKSAHKLDGGRKGLKGKPGKPGTGGNHSNDRSGQPESYLHTITNRDGSSYDRWETRMRKWEKRKKNGDRDDREKGATKAPDGGFGNKEQPDGTDGKQGTLSSLNPDTIVSATYLLMMMERAKAMHLIASLQMPSRPDSEGSIKARLKEVCELLDWIIQRSEWVQSEDKRKKAGRDPLEEDAFRDVYRTAIRARNYAGNYCNPFHESLLEPVIPNLSYDSLGRFLDEEIGWLGDIKKEYKEVAGANDVLKDEENTFNVRGNTNNATKAIYTSKKEACLNELPEVAANIGAIKESLAIVKGRVAQKADEFKKAVTAFGFPTWDELVNAITMTAFASPLAIVEGLDLFHKGLTETSAEDGMKINKQLIVQKTISLKGDFEKCLKISYDSVTGVINMGDQGLLIADLQEYDKIVQKFMSYTSARELHKLIQDFFDVVLQLNNAIMHYNTLLLQIAQMDERLSNLEVEQAQDSKRMSKLSDPTLAYLTATLAGRYSMALENCAHQLAVLERAYRYNTLEDTSEIFNNLFRVDMQWGESYDKLYQMDLSDLKACKNQLVNAYQEYLGRQVNPPSRFPPIEGGPGLLLLLETGSNGRYEFIGEKDSAEYRFEFNIVRSKNETLDADGNRLPSNYYIPDVADFYDVRLLHDGSNGVKLHIVLEDGSSPDNISAVLVHGSLDKIYNRNAEEQIYRLKGNVPFPIITNPVIQSPKLSTSAFEQSGATYRQIGLYSHWVLVISKRNGANPNFNPEKVKSMQLEFSVRFGGHA